MRPAPHVEASEFGKSVFEHTHTNGEAERPPTIQQFSDSQIEFARSQHQRLQEENRRLREVLDRTTLDLRKEMEICATRGQRLDDMTKILNDKQHEYVKSLRDKDRCLLASYDRINRQSARIGVLADEVKELRSIGKQISKDNEDLRGKLGRIHQLLDNIHHTPVARLKDIQKVIRQ